MAFDTPTNPQAAIVEAAELRKQAAALNARADALDPPKETKPKKKAKKSASKKGKK